MDIKEAQACLDFYKNEDSLDEKAAIQCPVCHIITYDHRLSGEVAPEGYRHMEGFAAFIRPCEVHKPMKRCSWLSDIRDEAFAAFASEKGRVFPLEELRSLLPKGHKMYKSPA